jgi:BlaI family transcriptional regulator, penicillinase repressor
LTAYEDLRTITLVIRKTIKPTDAELQILQVLWRRGPSSVRDVHGELGGRTGYTTILKLMQIMTDKGLLTRDDRERSHIYRTMQPESHTQRRLAGDLMERAFGGSARKLVAAALSSRRATSADLEEIKKLIDAMKGGPS